MKYFMSLILLFSCFFSQAEEMAKEISQSSSPTGLNFLESVLSASPVVQITFLILIVMSIVSWAIILQKHSFLKEVEKSNSVMKDVFLKDGSFEVIYNLARSNEQSSLARIFIGGYNEMQKILKKQNPQSLRGIDNVERALRKECENEISHMETHLGFLATVGSSGPFIGLFGTVFGIMNSFNKIAVMGSASLNVVAPGIAEALLATAVGLFAAIPASIFYNNYITQIKKAELTFNNFMADFLNVSKRNFFQE